MMGKDIKEIGNSMKSAFGSFFDSNGKKSQSFII